MQCGSSGNHLGYRAWLIRVRDAVVFKVFALIELILNILVGIYGIGIGHGEDLAGRSIKDHSLRARSLGVGLGLLQLLLHISLQVQIEGEGDIAAINGINDITERAGDNLAIRGYVLG